MSDGIAMGENPGLGYEAERMIPGHCRKTTWMARSFRHGTMGGLADMTSWTEDGGSGCTVVLARCHTTGMAWTPEELGTWRP
ncbi:hypothetical protein Pyn_00954 [Prunus yedoensis var. nudiflora]|uniref:Uncharacterized protein n=1 Tax=Prunus yedoensis var. nudiflora TaxID=2094558 RepID=A0A314UII3_PRUYE|nr:hypothetical protein Pyn_00954 [Prunus yedoensis var. nudiflora]